MAEAGVARSGGQPMHSPHRVPALPRRVPASPSAPGGLETGPRPSLQTPAAQTSGPPPFGVKAADTAPGGKMPEDDDQYVAEHGVGLRIEQHGHGIM